MRIPFTLSRYIAKQFSHQMGIVFGVLASIILLIDLVEMIRRTSNKDVAFGIMLEMVLMKFPHGALEIVPFAILLGSILTFSKMTHSSELIVTRASGISVWQFLSPALMVGFLLGTIIITTVNPLASAMLSRFEKLEAKYIEGQTSMLSVSSSGLWVHQPRSDNKGKVVTHALRVSQEAMELYDVTLFMLNQKGTFDYRIDAKSAKLDNHLFSIPDATISRPGKPPESHLIYTIPTSLKAENIQESFASPETLSFWDLPEFIRHLKAAGFSALRHRLHFHSLLASPFFYCAMIFIAASFALGLPRQGKTGILMAGGITVGFIIRFLSDVILALGMSGTIPIILAAWAPMLISMAIGAVLMLHFEDG